MSRSSNKVIGITLGDPAGIGPEVTARALASCRVPKGIKFALIGNLDVFLSFWPKKKDLPFFLPKKIPLIP